MYGRNDPNSGFLNPNKNPRNERVMDDRTGDAGQDGFTRLSQADRSSGLRQPIADAPWPRYQPQEG